MAFILFRTHAILPSVLQLSAANTDSTGVDDEDLTIAPQTVNNRVRVNQAEDHDYFTVHGTRSHAVAHCADPIVKLKVSTVCQKTK
jgi:hypothetical protein